VPITLVEGQKSSGEFNASSGAATLPGPTAAGNTVLLWVDTNNSGGIVTPSGFVQDSPTFASSTNKLALYRRSNVPADETSWTITLPASAVAPVAWEVREYEGIDPDFPVDVKPSALNSSASASSIATSAAPPTNTVYDGLLVAGHGINGATTTPPTWSGHTSGVTEDTDQGAVGATNSVGLSVSSRPVASIAAVAVTATATATAAVTATHVIYAATGSKRNFTLDNLWGFEHLTAAGLTTGGSNARHFETQVGAPEVVNDPTKARTGSGYLRLSATAAAENVVDAARSGWVDALRAVVGRRCLRFDGGLPSVDTELFSYTGSATVVVRYVAASQKLGCKIGTGAEVLSDAAVAADQWVAVDLRFRCFTTANTCDWQVTYDATPGASSVPVEQAQASFTAGAGTTAYVSRLGWATAITPGVPVLFDDCADASLAAVYPLGDLQVRLLKVDPAATPTVTTAASFSTFTDNGGTVNSTFDAVTARDAVDEVPPTIGATADGFCQDAIGASDYVQLPMQTYQAAPDGAIRGVKWMACGWAAAGTAATIGFRAWDGSAETLLMAGSIDPEFDASTTSPAWRTGMVKPAGGWTQAKLDALAFRVGFSDDAAPDIGVHAIYAEVCVQVAAVQTLFGTLATQALDPTTGGVLGVTVDTNVTGQAADLYYEEGGTPTDVPVAADTSHNENIDAPDAPTVNYIALYPAPEPES
jgi:hypothetical protein